MATIHRREGTVNWFAAFYLPDGRRAQRSTGTSNKRNALRIALKYDDAARIGKQKRLTEKRARETIADIFAIANDASLPSNTVEQYLTSWLAAKKLEVADSSMIEYNNVVKSFSEHLGDKVKQPVDALQAHEVESYRTALSKRLSGSSVNKHLKVLRGAWTKAIRLGVATENVFQKVDFVESNRGGQRRAFTLPELNKILLVASQEWRGMILFGIYTGQRLGDIQRLTWQNIDLVQDEISFVARKTHRQINLPIASPLRKYLDGIASSDDPAQPLFPSLHGWDSATLSGQFRNILASVGLVETKAHTKTGKGRNTKREDPGLSFHCLRHTATSLLKNAGVSDVVAREIIGHESAAISRVYTHIEAKTLKHALNQIPEIG